VIGLLGNSGNSNNPHLHFSIQDSPHPLTSTSLPYVIDRFGFEGRGGPGATFGQITVTGNPHRERRSYPLYHTVANFSR
jgi:murein DD-endopeptidase MepM/ murein hydrolase activator NlpD